MEHKTALQIARETAEAEAREAQRAQNAEHAKIFIEAIKTIAEKPQNLDNLEGYLTWHFPEWIEKHANTPEKLASELYFFANDNLLF